MSFQSVVRIALVTGAVGVFGLGCAVNDETRGVGEEVTAFGGPTSNAGSCGNVKPGGSQEGEIYGNFYVNEYRSCPNAGVALYPYLATQARLHYTSYAPELSVQTSNNYVKDFEWWDPLGGGMCGPSVATYVSSGSSSAEAIHAGSGPQEGHCVRPGVYLFTDGDREFDVEYIQPSGTLVTNLSTGNAEAVETVAYDPNSLYFMDLVINVDRGTSPPNPGKSAQLHIDAQPDPYEPNFTNQTSPVGTKDTWFRFSTAHSASNWAGLGGGRALARLYWDTTDPGAVSPFYDFLPEGVRVMRLKKYPNPTTASKVYTVGLELMRPDEEPAGPTVTRTITVNRINPDLAPGTITMPASTIEGGMVTVTLQEKNLLSTAAVEGGWTGQFYFSANTTLDGSDHAANSFVESDSIAPSATKTVGRSVTVPGAITTGSWYIIARLDRDTVVIESNESNNTGASAATISIVGLAAPSTPSVTSCEETGGGKRYATYTFSWTTQAGLPGTVEYDVAENTTNNSSTASIIRTGPATTTTEQAGPYLISGSTSRYIWVRLRNGATTTAWVALADNPLYPPGGCLA